MNTEKTMKEKLSNQIQELNEKIDSMTAAPSFNEDPDKVDDVCNLYKESISLAYKTDDEWIISNQLYFYGEFLLGCDMTEESQKILSQAVSLQRHLADKNVQVAHLMATALYDLGYMHENEHEYKKAQGELEESLSLFSSFNTEDDEATRFFMALTYKCYGNLFLNRDNDKIKQERYFSKANDIWKQLSQENPENTISYIESLNDMANIHANMNRIDDAIEEANEAIKLSESLEADERAYHLSYSMASMCNVLMEAGRLEEAEKYALEANALTPNNHWVYAVLTELRILQKDFSEAEKVIDAFQLIDDDFAKSVLKDILSHAPIFELDKTQIDFINKHLI
jgi:tetratricopeptide (TPR) repeat protein